MSRLRLTWWHFAKGQHLSKGLSCSRTCSAANSAPSKPKSFADIWFCHCFRSKKKFPKKFRLIPVFSAEIPAFSAEIPGKNAEAQNDFRPSKTVFQVFNRLRNRTRHHNSHCSAKFSFASLCRCKLDLEAFFPMLISELKCLRLATAGTSYPETPLVSLRDKTCEHKPKPH